MSGTRTLTEASNDTITETVTVSSQTSVALQAPQESRSVSWATDTVDNEHMNKKSSKCCCIYKKTLKLGESSSESDSSDDDTNPYERMKKPKKKVPHSHDHSSHGNEPSQSAPS